MPIAITLDKLRAFPVLFERNCTGMEEILCWLAHDSSSIPLTWRWCSVVRDVPLLETLVM